MTNDRLRTIARLLLEEMFDRSPLKVGAAVREQMVAKYIDGVAESVSRGLDAVSQNKACDLASEIFIAVTGQEYRS